MTQQRTYDHPHVAQQWDDYCGTCGELAPRLVPDRDDFDEPLNWAEDVDDEQDRCHRCGERFAPRDERAEVVDRVESTSDGTITMTITETLIVHVGCMKPSDTIA